MARQRSNKETGGVLLYVRIQPRASKNEIVMREDGSIKIRLTAPPVDGAANEALVKFLAGTLSVAKSQVTIISGETARDKVIRITGVPDEDVMRLLNIREE
jgi:uncharacterized protein (TIGR00251 family)